MYRYSKEQQLISKIIYAQTPIDTIVSTCEGPNFVDVVGYAGGDTLTYRIYDSGTVVEK